MKSPTICRGFPYAKGGRAVRQNGSRAASTHVQPALLKLKAVCKPLMRWNRYCRLHLQHLASGVIDVCPGFAIFRGWLSLSSRRGIPRYVEVRLLDAGR